MGKAEEIRHRIVEINDSIFDLREQINSETCKYYSQLYSRLLVLETELRVKQRELDRLIQS
jgi:hypothetical protein